MNPRRAIGWVLLAVTAGCASVAAIMPSEDWPLGAIGAVGSTLIFITALGALLVDRRPEHPIGWILVAIGFLLGAGLVATQYAERALVTDPGSLPGGAIAAWLQAWLWTPIIGALPLLILLFPTGKPPSRRWRPVGWATLVLTASILVTTALRPGDYETFPGITNPLGLGPMEPLARIVEQVAFPAIVLFALAALTSMVIRFRRSVGTERQQLKWFVYAVAAGAGLTLMNPITWLFTEDAHFVVSVVLGFVFPLIGLLLLPVGITVAILRFRLYDIDRLVTRTVSYAALTVVLAGVYILAVLIPTALLGTTQRPDWVVAAGTLAVAGAFGPVRRRVQTRVDRRFNRGRYDAEATIGSFTSRLREQTDIDALGVELRDVVARTMHPQHVSLWMRRP